VSSSITALRAGPVSVVRIDRPEVRNALNLAALTELVEVLERETGDPEVAALVVTGGPEAFCTGEDLREAPTMEQAAFVEQIEKFQRVADLLRNARQPVVAAVGGPAVGGGLEIAVNCDLRIAATNAFFSCPEVRWGLVITNGASVLLRDLVGEGWTRELTLFGTTLDAAEAQRIGLVTRVVDPEDLVADAMALATKAAGYDAQALMLTKELLNADPRPWSEILAAETTAVTKGFAREEVQRRLKGFGSRAKDVK
jgi:enoyl-CoA hydratase/carnithine racemase